MWVVSFPLQAGAINICKAYANHPEERHNIAGMSEETLEIIQASPLISGEKGDQGRDLLKVTQTSRPETGLVQGSRLSIVLMVICHLGG